MNSLLALLFQLPVLLISLTVHEFSHGLAANLLGDDTAKRAGRLTLNPISHIDPIGLLMLFIAHIGWAKPVPINPYNFKYQKRDTAITAAAGPAANFIMAILLSLLINVFPPAYSMSNIQVIFNNIIFYAILINLALGLFNLIPIPPLDGSKIIGGFMTDEMYYKYTAKERQGAMILMIFFAIDYFLQLHIISRIISTPLNFLLELLTGNGLF